MLTIATPVSHALAQAKDFVQKTAFTPRPEFDAKKPYDAAQAGRYFKSAQTIQCDIGTGNLVLNLWYTPFAGGSGIDGIANVSQSHSEENGVAKALVTGNADKFFIDFLTADFNVSGRRVAIDRKTGQGVFGTRDGKVFHTLNCK